MTGWRVHAWALMHQHCHLFIQAPEPNLAAGMSWLQDTVTRRHNVQNRRWVSAMAFLPGLSLIALVTVW